MSEIDPLGGQAGTDPAPGGEVGESIEQPPTGPSPDDFVNLDDLAGKYVNVKVDGEERPVEVTQALNDWNANSVAQQRFQEASRIQQEAQSALRLQQALNNAPGLTVQALAHQAGVPVEEFLGLTPPQQQQQVVEEYADPMEQRLAQQDQTINSLRDQLEAQQADMRLRDAVGQLRQTFGATEEDARTVVAQAAQNRLPLESLPFIYQALQHQKTQAQQQAVQQHQQSQVTDDAARRAAAAAAGQVIATDPGVASGGLTQEQSEQYTTPRAAVEAAVDQLL